MKTYQEIQEILKAPGNLSTEEEAAVFQYYERNKTTELRNLILEKNLGLVNLYIQRSSFHNIDHEDLFHAGILGLIEAIDRFQYKKGNRFSTYSYFWIRNYIVDFVFSENRTIPIPSLRNGVYRTIWKIDKKYMDETGKHPSPSIVAEESGYEEKQVQDAMYVLWSSNSVSLDQSYQIDRTGGQVAASDFVRDPNAEDEIEQSAYEQDIKNFHKRLKEILTDKEYRILSLRYGFEDGKERSLREIGKIMGMKTTTLCECLNRIVNHKLQIMKYREEFSGLLDYFQ